MDLRSLSLLPQRTREPLRSRALYRTGHRWRLRGVDDRRRALLLRIARGLLRPSARSAAVRGTDRLSGLREWPVTPSGSVCTGLVPRRTSSPRSHAFRVDVCSRSLVPETRPDRPRRASSASSGRATRSRRPQRSWTRRSSSPLPASLCLTALRAIAKGGIVVCAGIHMSDIPSFPYDILWGERTDSLGRQPHPPGCPRVLGPRAPRPGSHRGSPLHAGGHRPRPGGSARRTLPGRRGDRDRQMT